MFPSLECLSWAGLSVATLWLSVGAICRFSEGLSVITYMFLPAGHTAGINLCVLNVCIFIIFLILFINFFNVCIFKRNHFVIKFINPQVLRDWQR